MSTVASLLLLPNFLFSPPKPHGLLPLRPNSRVSVRFRFPSTLVSCSTGGGKKTAASRSDMDSPAVDCVGTGTDVECFVAESSSEADQLLPPPAKKRPAASFEIGGGKTVEGSDVGLVQKVFDWALLVSPFFFWGTAMVAMKEVIPKTGPFFVSAFRLIPAGALLIGFATVRGRKQPTGALAWLSIVLFGVVDAACFQGFLAEGLQRTTAGLGSVIIDSQPLTVAILAAVLFGESIGAIGAAGLVLGVIGLLLLEVPALSFEGHSSTIWGSGEWWMLLAAQSMAVGTVMVRWVSKYSDPVMATGWVDTLFQYFFLLITLSIKEWIHLLSPFLLEGFIMSCYLHMIIGGLPLLVISVLNHDPAMSGNIMGLTSNDLLALCYTSIFGSAISYGVYFYNATRGSLTKLSSLTFLTPLFASIFGFLYLGETFSPLQLAGALVTVIAIYMVNYRDTVDEA